MNAPLRRSVAYPFHACMIKQGLLVVAALCLFVGGILAGNFATTAWPGPGRWFGPGKPVDAAVLDKLNSELSLTPSQTARIAPIITAACAQLRLLAEERRSQDLALMDEISATISPDLAPNQRQRLEALESERQNRTSVRSDMRIVALY